MLVPPVVLLSVMSCISSYVCLCALVCCVRCRFSRFWLLKRVRHRHVLLALTIRRIGIGIDCCDCPFLIVRLRFMSMQCTCLVAFPFCWFRFCWCCRHYCCTLCCVCCSLVFVGAVVVTTDIRAFGWKFLSSLSWL